MRVVARLDGSGVLFGRFISITRAVRVTPEDEQLAQMLHAFTAQFFANLGQVTITNFSLVAASADLDQCVRGQGEIDLVQHGWSQPVLSHHDDRIEMVSGGAQRTSGAGRK